MKQLLLCCVLEETLEPVVLWDYDILTVGVSNTKQDSSRFMVKKFHV